MHNQNSRVSYLIEFIVTPHFIDVRYVICMKINKFVETIYRNRDSVCITLNGYETLRIPNFEN